ncbi:hypothetical protein MMU07_20895 [Aquiflexum sp. LQ15W]|uniref:hypothetical protein n=1 Tax=Cognataquiflexum nitidum TaxID=2922272 RepID=UPI001F13B911|nr:hypothetical protein [Cognataquiflexum nitidum]MCH6202047.1 hypothetical protein [Cognataquiflexum nitidum]
MKTIYKLFTLICYMAVYQVHAAVITVSNRPGDIAQFTSITAAINAASDGDFIYVSSSGTSYGSFTLSKRLTIVGAGHNPNVNDPLASELGQVSLAAGSSGSQFIGLRIFVITFSGSATEINNITIKRNSLNQTVTTAININSNSRNWTIEENIIGRIGSNSGPDFQESHLIRNNIIVSFVSGVKFSTFSNNIFKTTGEVFTPQISQSNNIVNNIFFQNNLNNDFAANRIVNCVFNNNIFFGSNNPTSLPAGNNNTGENNFFVNPLFVSVPNNTFNYGNDYMLQASSQGINAGTDGTDIGLFGGIGYTVSGEPAIPQVTLFNILNPIVPQNGNLNVRIESRANN